MDKRSRLESKFFICSRFCVAKTLKNSKLVSEESLHGNWWGGWEGGAISHEYCRSNSSLGGFYKHKSSRNSLGVIEIPTLFSYYLLLHIFLLPPLCSQYHTCSSTGVWMELGVAKSTCNEFLSPVRSFLHCRFGSRLPFFSLNYRPPNFRKS